MLLTICPPFSCSSGFCFVFVMIILLTCGDIESNTGPRRWDSCYNLLICHWNLNSMTAHDKVNQLLTTPTLLHQHIHQRRPLPTIICSYPKQAKKVPGNKASVSSYFIFFLNVAYIYLQKYGKIYQKWVHFSYESIEFNISSRGYLSLT